MKSRMAFQGENLTGMPIAGEVSLNEKVARFKRPHAENLRNLTVSKRDQIKGL